jgi:hypothetical protein
VTVTVTVTVTVKVTVTVDKNLSSQMPSEKLMYINLHTNMPCATNRRIEKGNKSHVWYSSFYKIMHPMPFFMTKQDKVCEFSSMCSCVCEQAPSNTVSCWHLNGSQNYSLILALMTRAWFSATGRSSRS